MKKCCFPCAERNSGEQNSALLPAETAWPCSLLPGAVGDSCVFVLRLSSHCTGLNTGEISPRLPRINIYWNIFGVYKGRL